MSVVVVSILLESEILNVQADDRTKHLILGLKIVDSVHGSH